MEIKMNKEIRDYKEKVVMGMTLRQITAAASGIVFCVYVVFHLRSISEDFAAFCCILVILPFAVLGDFLPKVNNVPFRKFLLAWVRYAFLVPKQLKFSGRNYDREIWNSGIAAMERKEEIEHQLAEKKERKIRRSQKRTTDHSGTGDVERRHFFQRKHVQ